MKLPVGKIYGAPIHTIFEALTKRHLDIFYKTIAEYEPQQLYSQWIIDGSHDGFTK